MLRSEVGAGCCVCAAGLCGVPAGGEAVLPDWAAPAGLELAAGVWPDVVCSLTWEGFHTGQGSYHAGARSLVKHGAVKLHNDRAKLCVMLIQRPTHCLPEPGTFKMGALNQDLRSGQCMLGARGTTTELTKGGS